MNGKKIQRAAYVLLAALLLCYVGYQFYLSGHRGLVTELAMYGTVSDSLRTQGFIVRDEQVIHREGGGVLNYRVEDGARVQKGGVIADVFMSEADASAQNRVEQLTREIDFLQGLSRPTDTFSVTPAAVDEHIYMTLSDLLINVRDRELSKLSDGEEDLLSALNRKLVITGEESEADLAPRIVALSQEKSDVASGVSGPVDTVTAPAGGFFISTVDGLENAADLSTVTEITPEGVEALLAKTPQDVGGVGKICPKFVWYALCVVDEQDMWHFEESDEVKLGIPSASSQEVSATIAARNRDPKTGKTALVIECSDMDKGFAQARIADIVLTSREYSGVLVRESALRFCDVPYIEYGEDGTETERVAKNVKGVYVLNGKQLEFVQVFSERTVNGYAICKTELSDAEREALVTDNTIRLYDNVVTEGTDLYDGKPV